MAETSTQDLKTTPLDSLHRELGGKMVPFAGYAMPVQYAGGIIAEHTHTRAAAGLFDVSHMGQAVLSGDDPAAALETLVPGDISALEAGRMRYTMLTNDEGGILDDLMVTRRDGDIFLVVNAACKDQDFARISEKLAGRAELTIIEDRALLALQGPKAADVLARFAPDCAAMAFMSYAEMEVAGAACFVTRSGYTGEDGYEISIPADKAEHVARTLLGEREVEAIGLGARDSLRLEAGLCLYGSDIDTTTTPIEAGLIWTISKRRRAEGGFPGADVIQKQIEDGVTRKRVGLKPAGRAPVRPHAEVLDENGTVIGEVTSGGFGPSVGGPVAMGYVACPHHQPGTKVNFKVRGKELPGEVVRLPFTEHRYFKG
jgi:aminomethyltransferase